jgi:ATP-dependent DNA helicase RecG
MNTLEHYLNQPEGQTNDKKSGRIDPKALAISMVAMANANSGTIAVGLEDDGMISGIDEMTESIFQQDGFMLRVSLSS